MQGFTYKYGDRPLEGYTIQRAAGRGGFGEVYYALSDSGREVALKVVQGHEAIELRGISQCMNLKSPHLVTIFDVKYNEAGRPFVIMEFVAGPSLRQLLDESPAGVGTQKTAFFLREIAKGLTYLHDRGIVHRDLKPGNVFYEDGYVKIGDYGLSKAMSASRHSGQTITVGTVHYMAPEIGQGNYDGGIDIYALGCMVYEMLTGQTPYLGASPGEILMKHMVEEPDLTNIEEPFATVIRKALAKDPKDRFQTVQEMVEAVFGSQHIQQSVSCFSPESLTMVAGRVASKVTAGGPGSSGQQPTIPGAMGPAGAGQGEWVDRFGERMQQVEETIEAAGDRIGEKLERAADKIRQKWQARKGQVPPTTPPQAVAVAPQEPDIDPKRDPLTVTQRRLMGLGSGTAVGLGAGLIAGQTSWGGSPDGALLASLIPFAGILVGMTLAWPWLGRSLAMESRLVRRLVFGGIAGIFVLIAGYGGFAIAEEAGMKPFAGRYFPGTVLAIIIPLFLMDWSRAMDPARRQRISLGHAIWAGVLGLILASILDGVAPVVMGALCAASLGLQAAMPYDPLARRSSRRPRTVQMQATPELGPSRTQERAEHRQDGAEQRAQRRNERYDAWQPYPQGPDYWPAPGKAGVWTSKGYRLLPRGVSPCKRLVTLLLAIFLGTLGVHRFYVGKIATGLLWFLTGGLLGIGYVVDLILIASGAFQDRFGRRLVVWHSYDELGHFPAVPAGWQGQPPQMPAGQGPATATADASPQEQPAAPAFQPAQSDDRSDAGLRPLSAPLWDSQSSVRQGVASRFLGFLGGLLLFVTLVLGVVAGLTIPGAIVFGKDAPWKELKPLLDVLCDPQWFSVIASIAMLVAGLLVLGAAGLLINARRWAGGAHVFRGLLGCLGVLLSLYAFWAAVVPDSYCISLAMTHVRQQHVQEAIQALSRGTHGEGQVVALLLLFGSIVLLAWPARQTRDLPAVGKGV